MPVQSLGNSNWKQYAVHAPDVPLRKIMEFEKYKEELIVDPPVQEMPVQSLITVPSAHDILGMKARPTIGSHVRVKASGKTGKIIRDAGAMSSCPYEVKCADGLDGAGGGRRAEVLVLLLHWAWTLVWSCLERRSGQSISGMLHTTGRQAGRKAGSRLDF